MGWRRSLGGVAGPADDLPHGHQVLDENGPVAVEKGAGLKSYMLLRSWLVDPEYERHFMPGPQTPHVQPGRRWLRSFPVGALLISILKGSGP